MNEPLKVTAGDSVSWSFADAWAYGLWVFEYQLRGPQPITIAATAAEGSVEVSLTGAATASWSAGRYDWRLYRSNGADRVEVGRGLIEILPNFVQIGAGHDARSLNERMLDAIRATLEGRVLSDHEQYTIDGRSLSRIPILELERLKTKYSRLVYRERVAAGLIHPRKRILMRLSDGRS